MYDENINIVNKRGERVNMFVLDDAIEDSIEKTHERGTSKSLKGKKGCLAPSTGEPDGSDDLVPTDDNPSDSEGTAL